MAGDVNKIKNADFVAGRDRPRAWTWTATGTAVSWLREDGDKGVTLTADQRHGSGRWSQLVTCKPGIVYRVEATVACELDAADESAGCVLTVQPLVDGKPHDVRRETPGIHTTAAPTTIRTYYEVPDDVRRIEVSIGLVNARGRMSCGDVRMIEVLDPDVDSHVLAVPPPAHGLPRPRKVSRVCVCSATADDRPITAQLREYFGSDRVSTAAPDKFPASGPKADALLLPDAQPPRAIRSLTTLAQLAQDRIVVISLEAFATLTRGALRLRRIEQNDDAIHTTVTFANFATQGFALDDMFPYAWPGKKPGCFAQNQYYRTGASKAFLKKHGFETLLVSECDQEATSGRPICLHKETPRGGLFVLDIQPAETPSSTFGEPVLAMHLLLTMLCRSVRGMGQYIVPFDTERDLRSAMREMPLRLQHVVVHDADVPSDEVTEQIVTVGKTDHTFGLPITPKPVIIVRSGLSSGDMESTYGSWLWLKQLVRPEPFTCPYAMALSSRYRFAWIPSAAQWEPLHGWQRTAEPPESPIEIDTDGAGVAALIDVVSRPINRARVVVPKLDRKYEKYATWLPALANCVLSDRGVTLAVNDGEPFANRSNLVWRRLSHRVEVVAEADAFGERAHRDVIKSGGQVIRIEIPGSSTDFSAHSIQRTDLTATLLEHVIGLQYGLIAVNRQDGPVQFNGFPPVAPGEALIVDSRDLMLTGSGSAVG